jgi:guanylate kinase
MLTIPAVSRREPFSLRNEPVSRAVEAKSMAAPNPNPNPNPLLIVISAPSGTGKTTLCEQLLAVLPNLSRAITCTTREPRPGEQDGVDYYFLDAATFLKRVQAGNFLEHATVHGNSYGTLKSEVLGRMRQGQDVLLTVDVQGAATIRQKAEEDPELGKALVSVFLTPPRHGHSPQWPADASSSAVRTARSIPSTRPRAAFIGRSAPEAASARP